MKYTARIIFKDGFETIVNICEEKDIQPEKGIYITHYEKQWLGNNLCEQAKQLKAEHGKIILFWTANEGCYCRYLVNNISINDTDIGHKLAVCL